MKLHGHVRAIEGFSAKATFGLFFAGILDGWQKDGMAFKPQKCVETHTAPNRTLCFGSTD